MVLQCHMFHMSNVIRVHILLYKTISFKVKTKSFVLTINVSAHCQLFIIIISGSTVLIRTLATLRRKFYNLVKTIARNPLDE
jgi:hypothetical protein